MPCIKATIWSTATLHFKTTRLQNTMLQSRHTSTRDSLLWLPVQTHSIHTLGETSEVQQEVTSTTQHNTTTASHYAQDVHVNTSAVTDPHATSTDPLHGGEDDATNNDSLPAQGENESSTALALLHAQLQRHFEVLKREYEGKTGRGWTPLEACTDADSVWDGGEGEYDLLDRMELELIGLQCIDA